MSKIYLEGPENSFRPGYKKLFILENNSTIEIDGVTFTCFIPEAIGVQNSNCESCTAPMSAAAFVKQYAEASEISIKEFYEHLVPMPDNSSPYGWAAVSNNPSLVKAHVNNYLADRPMGEKRD